MSAPTDKSDNDVAGVAVTAVKRREFFRLAAALGVAPWLPSGCTSGSAGSSQSLQPESAALTVAPPPPPPARMRAPTHTGVLEPAEIDELWRLFAHIDRTWNNQCSIDTRAAFKDILDLKTSRVPSYLTEYREAIDSLRQLRERHGAAVALHQMYFAQSNPHVHHHVIVEFLRLHIAHGGFRAFGYRNYKGYIGGSFAERSKLPYRPAKVQTGDATLATPRQTQE